MNENKLVERIVEMPVWAGPGGRIDEVLFCKAYLSAHDLVCVDGTFFTRHGRLPSEDALRADIYRIIGPYISTSVSRKVDSILAALRLACRCSRLEQNDDQIHVANGTLNITGGMSEEMMFCRNRLPVRYNRDAPLPERWLDFLDELLYPEDIPTLQEFMGYCLIPTTRAQKMLMIIGDGGEGKSRIGLVMQALLGSNMSTGSLTKVETNPFARADLEHLLLMVDDDLRMEALTQTNNIKSIVTAELPMDLERKGIQSYQGRLYARFMAFGNGSLQALHDRSYGFFRRQIILSARPRRPGRRDDPFLGQKLTEEREGIFLWALLGLHQLRHNDFQFTISPRTQENLRQSMAQGNNILEFMESEGYFTLDPSGSVSSRELYMVYRDWCEDNVLTPLSSRSFSNFLCQNCGRYGMERSNGIPISNGRRVRGFLGIRVLARQYCGVRTSKYA